jgi:hypothetical protein
MRMISVKQKVGKVNEVMISVKQKVGKVNEVAMCRN